MKKNMLYVGISFMFILFCISTITYFYMDRYKYMQSLSKSEEFAQEEPINKPDDNHTILPKYVVNKDTHAEQQQDVLNEKTDRIKSAELEDMINYLNKVIE